MLQSAGPWIALSPYCK